MKTFTSATIHITDKALEKGVVLLDMQEFQELRRFSIPTYQLAGKAAERADKMVREGLKEHYEGKSVEASSFGEALKKYGEKKHKDILQRKVSQKNK